MNIASGCCIFNAEGVELQYTEFVNTADERLKNSLGNNRSASQSRMPWRCLVPRLSTRRGASSPSCATLQLVRSHPSMTNGLGG